MQYRIRHIRCSGTAMRELIATAATLALVAACDQRDTSPTAPVITQSTAPQARIVGATVTVLPGLGPPITHAADINDAGQVVGWSLDWTATRRAFLWSPTEGMQDLGTLGGTTAEATAINAAGHVVGFSETAERRLHAFLWTPRGGMQDLGSLGDMASIATNINNRGQVVGFATRQIGQSFESYALLWTSDNRLVELPTLGSRVTAAVAIDNAGRVVMDVVTASGDQHPFLWDKHDGMLDLGGIPGETTGAIAINERGQVVGNAIRQPDARPYIWTRKEGIRELGTLDGPAVGSVSDINDAGQAVGSISAMPGGRHAFVWSLMHGMEDLYAATGMTEARAINNRGQVVGGNLVATLRFGPANNRHE